MSRLRLRTILTALLTLVAMVGQQTWSLAGTTGGLSGVILDEKNAPVASASINVVSPSQSARTVSDASGHYVFLNLAPDTYTISVEKDGYNPVSQPGQNVFADQVQRIDFRLTAALKTIARVSSRAPGDLVKPGIGGDVYNVNSSAAAASAPLGGGGNLNSAYSAAASVPGVLVPIGASGWNSNAAYVRGQNSYFTGYEYDGVPVNRSFDNYNASTESSLGLQELQVYTGGGPASISTTGSSGFINQVIKTGTYPGFGVFNGGVASDAFYHSSQVEAGGSNPNRTFSYYVGISGYNQAFRFLNQKNGADLMLVDQPYGSYSYALNHTVTGSGDLGICQPLTGALPPEEAALPWGNPGCWVPYSGLFSGLNAATNSLITDRENVVNFHFAIPRANGLRDDVQALWSASALNSLYYGTLNDGGPGVAQFTLAATGAPYCATLTGCGANPYNVPFYKDTVIYPLPFGTNVAPGGTPLPTTNYYVPSSPTNRAFQAPLDPNGLNGAAGGISNDTGIVKLQYTHTFSPNAYARIFGYSFYSDWLQNNPTSAFTGEGVPFAIPQAPDYELITHTTGGELQFEDQLSSSHLFNFTTNYTQATVTRWNNSFFSVPATPIGYVAKTGTGFTCYNPTSGAAVPCLNSSYFDVASGTFVSPTTSATMGWLSNATAGPTGFAPAGTPASAAGAYWANLYDNGAKGSFNTVKPEFTSVSIADQWHASNRLLLNFGMRYDGFTYALPNSASAATAFYGSQVANNTCIQSGTNILFTRPLPPGVPPPAPALYVNGDCNAAISALTGAAVTGYVHPNGTTQDGILAPAFTVSSPSTYNLNYWEPRGSLTYTESPDTVWRASAGRFAQPPISASVQYLDRGGDDRVVWANTLNLGFFTPFHPIPGITTAQYDLSLERHIRGTDMSFKITPFYALTSNWQQQTFIGANFVTQVPVGKGRNQGVEFQFTDGDFTRNGLSGLISVTYTDAKIQFQNGLVSNATNVLNQAIQQYNQLAKGGSQNFPCFTPANATTGAPGVGTTTCSAAAGDIANPYFNAPQQGLLDPNAWYAPYSTQIAPNLNGTGVWYNSPWVISLIANYRHNKLAITPSFQFSSGTAYGSPLDVIGVDPRTCAQNSLAAGITAVSPNTNPLQCNYLSQIAPGAGQFSYLYIPNPQTGSFANVGGYNNPSIISGNLAVSYDVSPRIRVQVTAANLFHACFGGTKEPWTSAYPAGGYVCGYQPEGVLGNNAYVSNFYNGTGPLDKAANGITPYPWQLQSYIPFSQTGGIGAQIPPPTNVYFTVQIKL